MKVERVEEGFVIDQEYLSFIELEGVCKEIDDVLAVAIPDSAATTLGVIEFILDHYKDRLAEKLVILSDKGGYPLLRGGKE